MQIVQCSRNFASKMVAGQVKHLQVREGADRLGVSPGNLLELKLSQMSALNWPISPGITPVNFLMARLSTFSQAPGWRYWINGLKA